MSKTQNGKKALLLWAQKILVDYENVDMKDFSLSWRDGIAFLGILHFYLGEDKVPGVKQLKPHTNERENLNRAFGISTKLGIDQFMDTEDILYGSRPEPLSMQTQVIQFYQYFKDKSALGSKEPQDNFSEVDFQEEKPKSVASPVVKVSVKTWTPKTSTTTSTTSSPVTVVQTKTNVDKLAEEKKKKEEEEKKKKLEDDKKKQEEEKKKLDDKKKQDELDKKKKLDEEKKKKEEEAKKKLEDDKKKKLEDDKKKVEEEKKKKLEEEKKKKEEEEKKKLDNKPIRKETKVSQRTQMFENPTSSTVPLQKDNSKLKEEEEKKKKEEEEKKKKEELKKIEDQKKEDDKKKKLEEDKKKLEEKKKKEEEDKKKKEEEKKKLEDKKKQDDLEKKKKEEEKKLEEKKKMEEKKMQTTSPTVSKTSSSNSIVKKTLSSNSIGKTPSSPSIKKTSSSSSITFDKEQELNEKINELTKSEEDLKLKVSLNESTIQKLHKENEAQMDNLKSKYESEIAQLKKDHESQLKKLTETSSVPVQKVDLVKLKDENKELKDKLQNEKKEILEKFKKENLERYILEQYLLLISEEDKTEEIPEVVKVIFKCLQHWNCFDPSESPTFLVNFLRELEFMVKKSQDLSNQIYWMKFIEKLLNFLHIDHEFEVKSELSKLKPLISYFHTEFKKTTPPSQPVFLSVAEDEDEIAQLQKRKKNEIVMSCIHTLTDLLNETYVKVLHKITKDVTELINTALFYSKNDGFQESTVLITLMTNILEDFEASGIDSNITTHMFLTIGYHIDEFIFNKMIQKVSKENVHLSKGLNIKMLLSSIENFFDENDIIIFGVNEFKERIKIPLFSYSRQCADVCIIGDAISLLSDSTFKDLIASKLSIEQISYLLNAYYTSKDHKNFPKDLKQIIEKCTRDPTKLSIKIESPFNEFLDKKEKKIDRKLIFHQKHMTLKDLKLSSINSSRLKPKMKEIAFLSKN